MFMGYGLWVMVYGLWFMGYGLWVMGYGLVVCAYSGTMYLFLYKFGVRYFRDEETA
jgi:hypothetical protein